MRPLSTRGANLYQADDFLTCQRKANDFVVERIKGEDVLDGHGTHRKHVKTHAARVLKGQICTQGITDGIGHQAAQRLVAVNGCQVVAHYCAEIVIVVIVVNHFAHFLVAFWEFFYGKQLQILVNEFAVNEGEGAQCHKFDAALSLGNHHAVDELLLGHAGMAVSAEDGRQLREFLRRFAVGLITAMGEQEDGIAIFQLI